MIIMGKSLNGFLEERLAWEFAPIDDINIGRVADVLADSLEANGYCSEPYSTYEKALCCPINKRREKECLMTSCPNNTFCRLLRREGYIK